MALALAGSSLLATAVPDPAPFVPRVADGFALTPLVALDVPTAIVFGPGDGDGPDLYATVLTGDVMRVALAWTGAGPVATGVSTFATGFSTPLGLVFDGDVLYVADSVASTETTRVDGRVTRVEPDGSQHAVVSGLPNGRHNTNNLRFGPDGRLYIANGNPNDDGVSGGEVDVFPYSGAILSVDAAQVSASPAVLHWRDAQGNPIPADQIAGAPVNADFAGKVQVLAHGFRNVYDVAFDANGEAYTGMNGADATPSQDVVFHVQPGADYGYPFCFHVGPPGAGQAETSVANNPNFPDHDCSGVPPATAMIGWHTCATGLEVSNGGPFGHALYVGECGPEQTDVVTASANDPDHAGHNVGNKVVRVDLDANGDGTGVTDFVSGLPLAIDVAWGPDGALYLADATGVLRVAPLSLTQAAPADTGPVVVAGPGAWSSNYATPAMAAQPDGTLTFVNGDVMRHNVVAWDAYGDGSDFWCNAYSAGRCPLFWSALVGTGQTAKVYGLEHLEAGKTYTYYCTIHPGMRGTLVVAPGGL